MTNSKKDSELEDLRKSFGVDVAILAKYHPIGEVGLRAFDNNVATIKSKYITKEESDRRVLEVIEKAELFPERGVGSIKPVRAVRVELLRELLNGDTEQ